MAEDRKIRAVIFTGGRVRPGKFVQAALAAADLVIAADSGAKAALDFRSLPSVVVGDFDSLDEATRKDLAAKGVRFIAYDSAKDRTDTELAVACAIENQATEITVVGGIEGDRVDHILANLFSMVNAKVPIKFINGETAAWVVKGPKTANIAGDAGDTVSLIPLTAQVTGIKTDGLRYPLRDETLHMRRGRGVSNVMTRKTASVRLSRGVLLLVHNARPV